MRHYLKLSLFAVLAVIMCTCTPMVANTESRTVPHGMEDISSLTYKQLLQLKADLSETYNLYHIPSDEQKKAMLKAAQEAAENYYKKKGNEVSGWAWYDHEYTYTRDWDFYTLRTHLNYKDDRKRNHQAKIYAEIYCEKGRYVVAYLETDGTPVLDNRSTYQGALWLTQPVAKTNEATNIDLSTYTPEELTALSDKAQKEIEINHSASKKETSLILNLTKAGLEQYFLKMNYELKSYAWYDNEYSYLKDWDYYWLETHVDYEQGSSGKTEKVYAEVCKVGEEYELVYLRLGTNVIKDWRGQLVTLFQNGIPRYSWGGKPDSRYVNNTITATSDSNIEITQQNANLEQEESSEITESKANTPKTSYNGIFGMIISELSDEQLAKALDDIRTEQRLRCKTQIVLDHFEALMNVGTHQKLEAKIVDLPEDEPAPKLIWSTENEKIANVDNEGLISAVGPGSTIVTCSAEFAEGKSLKAECKVQVNVYVTSFTADKETLELSDGAVFTPVFVFEPENATEKGLMFESSDPEVALMDSKGNIQAVAPGEAEITAKTVDGSGKSVVIAVTVKNDSYLKHSIGSDLFEAVISKIHISNQDEKGNNDWYSHTADISGISFTVYSEGKNGRVLKVEVSDNMETGSKDIFFRVLNNIFSGQDLKTATEWLKQNIGKEMQTRIGDAYVILKQTVKKAPIMYITDEDHKDNI